MSLSVSDDWQFLASNDSDYTSYQLHIILGRSLILDIGALGRQTFPAGRYVYTGSARRNLVARVQRHLATQKKCRWHIDYLLVNPAAAVESVSLAKTPECELNQRTPGGMVCAGFGASDCRSGCGSHLKYQDQLSRNV